jgi:outer membrane receptor protein involved in Fe transport
MRVTLTVEDASGALSGALVRDTSGHRLAVTGANGLAAFDCHSPCHYQVSAQGFSSSFGVIAEDLPSRDSQRNVVVRLQPATAVEDVTVTAYRTPLGELQSPVTTRLLSETELQSSAAVTMDDKLRQLPGVELFRRSSSLVANPTSQGMSLRGLGSTSASRTLVTMDDVPLNDPVGGWIHWQELPELGVQGIEVVRGGASDLYGSSAIGGVMNVRTARPGGASAELRSSYAGQGTFHEGLLTQGKRGPWGGLLAAGLLGTSGYIQEAPWQRGPVDTASNVHAQNALGLVVHDAGRLRLFARANIFHESRANGTRYQDNATHLLRYAAGADWNAPNEATLEARLYGSGERYTQTFSQILNAPNAAYPGCSYRCGESPSRAANIPDDELGAAAHWSQPLKNDVLLIAGADVRDVRVWDREQAFGATGVLTNLHVRQRDTGLYGEALWTPGAWTLTASGRVDWFRNLDPLQTQWNGSAWAPTATQPPPFSQNVFDPRLGLSRKLGEHWALTASGFRAFRAPTPSELYRSTQVGNQLTKPNGNLRSERATGWEAGVASQRAWGAVRASYFLTQVNRPITAVTINPNSSPILLMRENLGQIESKGLSLDFELTPRKWLAMDGGYQYAHATVTRGPVDVGNWIPAVARNMGTLNARAFRPRWGTLNLQSRMSGRQFDNDANTAILHGYFRLDAFASHEFGRRFEVFAAGENLFDRTIEVAKTPTTTLGQRRVARFGLQMIVGHNR